MILEKKKFRKLRRNFIKLHDVQEVFVPPEHVKH